MVDKDTATYGIIDKTTGKLANVVGTKKECDAVLEQMRAKDAIKQLHPKIIKILKKYIDLKEEYYSLIALWILGTYMHSELPTFPYLYFNAMKGSGKSRTLKLITELSKDGLMMLSPTEAVLFRTTGTLAIDEFEGVRSKEKAAIRELLNASYKQGMKVVRLQKKKTMDGEKQVPEYFETYRPIVIANIWGMDEVLGDRCITLILEKSSNPSITMRTENFSRNNDIIAVKELVSLVSMMSLVSLGGCIYNQWEDYIDEIITTHTAHTPLTTHTTQTTSKTLKKEYLYIFNKIKEAKIVGRNLEMWLPMFFIASMIDDKVLNDTLDLSIDLIKEKTSEEHADNRDIMLYDFISRQLSDKFYPIKTLTQEFRQFVEEPEDWINTKWLGRALKRLNLIIDKRRLGRGRDVTLNVNKAQSKIIMFK